MTSSPTSVATSPSLSSGFTPQTFTTPVTLKLFDENYLI